ncbi:MAG TPA: glycosyltransferase family 2 protein [Thermoanaerobaculia bacterium]|jgi:GT2 family glycosyltransferase|nr:glycosyltransferase family 2 protein [Thermoanaerobaculia bacterium]
MRVAAVIPTIGKSPHLEACLRALRAQSEPVEIIVVDQGEQPTDLPSGLADQVLRPGRNLGFAAGTNLGIAATAAEYIATVNDDAIVEPGWLSVLIDALEGDSRLAAAQGANLRFDQPEILDGLGIAWNRRWQAVQIGAGGRAPERSEPARPIFGVSATAALYRRSALEAVRLGPDEFFDSNLGSYYEDVDLASRLAAKSFGALAVPAARAFHAGSTTGGGDRWRLVYGNRHLTLARSLGHGYWWRLPAFLGRDLIDLARAVFEGDRGRLTGILTGWWRAIRLLPRFARSI